MKLTQLALKLGLIIAPLNLYAAHATHEEHAPPQFASVGEVHHEHGLEVPLDERAPIKQLQQSNKKASLNALSINIQMSCAEFEHLQGAALVQALEQTTADCVNDLFSASGDSMFRLFQQAKMETIAEALADKAENYTGNNGNSILQMILYLRAGYYVQYYNSDQVGNYTQSLKDKVSQGLDKLFSSSHFGDTQDEHGNILSEAVILVDSSATNARYINRLTWLLDNFNADRQASWYMRNATNSVLTVYFRGHYNDDFVTLTTSDNTAINALINFSRREELIDSNAEFILLNTVREAGRFLQYGDEVDARVKPRLGEILNDYAMDGYGAKVWLTAAEFIDYYDNCSEYNICNYKQELEARVLSVRHTCSDTIKVRAQAVTAPQLSQICEALSVQEVEFHQQLNTQGIPVADDLNEDLEVVIFNSSSDYQSYAGILFNINTDNGGMYLEGNPSDPDNQARFIAYEAEWMDEFHVWNLTHEYVHYLDGRFNLYGDFGQSISEDTVWWIEGLAEYVSKKDDNPQAWELAAGKDYQLSQLFANNYNSGSDRVYHWGYLAVRYMFESNRSKVDELLVDLRAGNYGGYAQRMAQIGSSLDGDFHAWIDCNLAGSCNNDGIQTLNNGDSLTLSGDRNSMRHFRLNVPEGTTNLSIRIMGGLGDADLYVKHGEKAGLDNWDHRPYQNGNAENVTLETPQAGDWYIMLNGYDSYSNLVFDVSYQQAQQPATELLKETGISANGQTWRYVLVPENTTNLKFELMGGTGEAKLYVKQNGWPSSSDYDVASTQAGTAQSATIATPLSRKYYHILMEGDYSEVTLRVSAEIQE